MTENDNATLYVLGDRGRTVDGSANNVRGRQVKDKDGDGVGKVAELLVDDQEGKVRFLLVEHGGFLGFGATTSLIPVDAIKKITEHDVFVDQSRERVAAAPGYTPDLVNDRHYHANLYDHYGHRPYWDADYIHICGRFSGAVTAGTELTQQPSRPRRGAATMTSTSSAVGQDHPDGSHQAAAGAFPHASLGVPARVAACLFDLDGVLTDTAKLHAAAWKEMFDGYLTARTDATGTTFVAFDEVGDYDVQAVRSAGLQTAVVSSSANCAEVLDAAGIADLFQTRIDGISAKEQHLAGKPAPDTYLAAAKVLGVGPGEAAVFEDALSGVAAGRAGRFGFVVGVDRVGQADELRAHGANRVVTDLAQLLDPVDQA